MIYWRRSVQARQEVLFRREHDQNAFMRAGGYDPLSASVSISLILI
jgi:hypothetical protein